MKRFVLIASLLILAQSADARSLPLLRGGSMPIPEQAVVSSEGVTFVRRGEAKTFTLSWQDIDLIRLAKQDTDLEGARQRALLTGERTVLSPEVPKANPYAEFLAQPVRITFRPKELRQSRGETSTVAGLSSEPIPGSGVISGGRIVVAPIIITTDVSPNAPSITQTGVPGQNQRFVQNVTTTRTDTTVNTTRQPLDTNVAGFLEMISDDSQSSTGVLIRELREHPDLFTMLIAGLRDLHSQTEDSISQKAINALQQLSRIGPVSVDAQRDLAAFLNLARKRAAGR
ncbi:MAG: hypothetical protein WCL08_03405 [Verrucomicrobiota bacterium]